MNASVSLMPMPADTARRRRSSRRRGASIVEFAIVAPVAFITILGVMEVGSGLMAMHLLNDAAMAGCRVGIIEGKSSANIQSAATAVLTAEGISGETATVKVNDGSTDASSAGVGDEITVTVSVPVSKISWVPVLKYLGGSLQGQYTMRRE